MISIRRAKKLIKIKLIRWFGPKVTYISGVPVPPQDLRSGGPQFTGENFMVSARNEAQRLVNYFNISPESSILDVGCGAGRLAIGLIADDIKISSYEGVDVMEPVIRWCQKYITPEYPAFNFTRINIKNSRYNPSGQIITDQFRLPLDQEFDLIYLYSVFSHMDIHDIRSYLGEFNRLLAPNGNIFLTAFIETNVPPMTINPPNYRLNWSGMLHCVRYDKSYFELVLKEYGFVVDKFEYGSEVDGQSGVYIKRSI